MSYFPGLLGNFRLSGNRVARARGLGLGKLRKGKLEFNVSTFNDMLTNLDQGVVHHFHSAVSSFDAVIVGSVPLGGGVSSSASVEVTC